MGDSFFLLDLIHCFVGKQCDTKIIIGTENVASKKNEYYVMVQNWYRKYYVSYLFI